MKCFMLELTEIDGTKILVNAELVEGIRPKHPEAGCFVNCASEDSYEVKEDLQTIRQMILGGGGKIVCYVGKTPNAETQRAMVELEAGGGETFDNVEALMSDLNAEEAPKAMPESHIAE